MPEDQISVLVTETLAAVGLKVREDDTFSYQNHKTNANSSRSSTNPLHK